jgi:steroid 5-alpha reductase family enzyme
MLGTLVTPCLVLHLVVALHIIALPLWKVAEHLSKHSELQACWECHIGAFFYSLATRPSSAIIGRHHTVALLIAVLAGCLTQHIYDAIYPAKSKL